MIDLARSAGLSPEEIKEQEFKLKELEERRAASRPLGKRFAEAHKRKEQLLKRLESERQHREDLETKITKSKENTANLEHEVALVDAQLTACAREEASTQPMDQILNGIAALEDGVEGGSGGQADAVIKALQPLKALIQSLKVGCGAHPLPVDRDEDMLEEEDEEVRCAKNALQMAVESAAKRRKAATPPRSTGGIAEQGRG